MLDIQGLLYRTRTQYLIETSSIIFSPQKAKVHIRVLGHFRYKRSASAVHRCVVFRFLVPD